MQAIKILIVEDNPLFAISIEAILREMGHTMLRIVNSGPLALAAVKSKKPDLLILDISLKGRMDGIEVAEQLADQNIPVIFTTVHQEESIYRRAAAVAPYAYLTKPFDRLTFQSAIEAVLWRSGNANAMQMLLTQWQENAQAEKTLFVRYNNKLQKIYTPSIEFIEAEGNYVTIYTNTKKYLARMSLTKIKQELSSRLFVQVHRNYIIPIAAIEMIDLATGELIIAGKSVPLGGAYRQALLNKLHKL